MVGAQRLEAPPDNHPWGSRRHERSGPEAETSGEGVGVIATSGAWREFLKEPDMTAANHHLLGLQCSGKLLAPRTTCLRQPRRPRFSRPA
jgi:hypothetical protein